MSHAKQRRPRALLRRSSALLFPLAFGAALGLTRPPLAVGQDAAPAVSRADHTVSVAMGKAALVTHAINLRQVSISDPSIAEAVVVSPNEVLVNGKKMGSTSLVLWDASGRRELHSVEVTADAQALQRQFGLLFPNENLVVQASGNTFILSGSVSDASVERRAVAIAEATGATVVNSIAVPSPRQVLLQVRFAEVSRNALSELGFNILRVDPLNLRGADEGALSTGTFTAPGANFINDPPGPEQTFSDVTNLYLFDRGSEIGAFIRALQGKGMFKSLAEPNLLAMDGKEASFLAGGEFPYPVPQVSASGTSITVVFKEFGIRLNFTPNITNSGNIRMQVAPEVSSLDFANGLQIQGFQIPTLRARRASTEVELQDGQTFAIAGLIDNTMTENVNKFPILGDIPILGTFFRSKAAQQNRTELLVLVTPHVVQPSSTPPPLPTGEPETWQWDKSIREPMTPAGGR